MDPKLFYGKMNAVRIPDFDSEESDLSDEDDTRPEVILASESDEIEGAEEVKNYWEDIIIPATDSSDDEIPLSILKTELHKKKIQKKTKSLKNEWIEGNLRKSDNEIKFSGQEDLPPSISELETPGQFFKFLFPESLLKHITEQTNLYSVQQRPNKPANVKINEIEQFIGISIYMSIIQLPATRHYWNVNIGHPAVSKVMSCNRFEEIKRFLHFNNNDNMIQKGQPGHDKLFKIRPFLKQIREKLLEIPKEEFLAVDEQIIPTKARSQLKQYNPKKPHKWGFKNFVLSGISGFSYDFDLFAGSQSNTVPLGAPILSMSSNVVVKLSETIPRHQNYKLFFDNWFSSIPLMVYLNNEGILALGTVRLNRVPGASMPTEKEMKKRGRGHMAEKIAIIDDVDVSIVSWFDNKIVTTLSTYAGSEPRGEKKRFFKHENIHKMIPCPNSILIYNNYMGGVDLLDSMLGFYRIKIRSKKFYLRIFFHFIDMTVVNSWLLARRAGKLDMPLLDTKLAIADALCTSGKPTRQNRGRPSGNLQQLYENKRTDKGNPPRRREKGWI